MKNNLKAKQTYQFRTHKTYSAEEILAAGGTSAFAHKTGLSGKKQMEALIKIPTVEFSDTEWAEVLEMLKNDK
jgi:hypothetical protein